MSIKHVLIVDDSKSARLVLRKMLPANGLTVDMAESAEEALEILKTQPLPDAIFMDHTMPGMDGLAAVRQIKADPAMAKIPVAMYTSKEGEDFVREVKAHGVVTVLMKPASPRSLQEVIEQLETALAAVKPQTDPAKAKPVERAQPRGSIELLQDIAQTTAEEIFTKALTTQLLPLLETRLDDFKKTELAQLNPARFKEELTQVKEELLNGGKNAMLTIAGELYEQRSEALASTIEQKVTAQLETVQTQPAAELAAATQTEIQTLASAAAVEQARATAQEIARQAAQETAEKIGKHYEARVNDHLKQLVQRLNQQFADIKHSLEAASKVDPATLEEVQAAAVAAAVQQADEAAQAAVQPVKRSTRAALRLLFGLLILTVAAAVVALYYAS